MCIKQLICIGSILFISSFVNAYDDIDIKTSEEVFKQEIDDITENDINEIISEETLSFLNTLKKPIITKQPCEEKIINDLKNIYNKLDQNYPFNPSKGACNEYMGGSSSPGYRDSSEKNINYVYFYLILGAVYEYNKRIDNMSIKKFNKISVPELLTSNFICKEGPYFKNYFYDDKSTHYWSDRGSNNHLIRENYSKNRKNYKENEKNDIIASNVSNYINEIDKNFEKFNFAVSHTPANFESFVVDRLKSDFNNNDTSTHLFKDVYENSEAVCTGEKHIIYMFEKNMIKLM